MEEKERYEILNDGLIYDSYKKEYLFSPSLLRKEQMIPVCNLLNQQDKEIKKLEEYNNKYPYHYSEEYMKNNRKLEAENQQLKQQLAEKDAERELDNSFWKQECDSLQKTLVEKDKEIAKLTEELDDKNFCKDFVDLYTENKLKTQMLHENWKDKISFTIQQLEKVKSAFGLINSKLDKVETIKEYIHYIDHQINELKEMK